MRISLEQLDDEYFLDILLTQAELEKVLEDRLVTGFSYILNERVYVGIGLNTNMEDEDATSEIEEQEGDW